MALPFTSDQFFGVFAEYNRSFWFVALAWWFASAAALAGAWRNPRQWSGALMYLLATLWIWNAVAYHALLFTHINPAAWLFAGAASVGILFHAVRNRSSERPSRPRCILRRRFLLQADGNSKRRVGRQRGPESNEQFEL